jgi:hypothetical protein
MIKLKDQTEGLNIFTYNYKTLTTAVDTRWSLQIYTCDKALNNVTSRKNAKLSNKSDNESEFQVAENFNEISLI